MTATDTRIFKLVNTMGRVRLATRAGVAARSSEVRYGTSHGWLKIFATNAEATDGWTDVTQEMADHYGG